tara:strand:- start:7173 stop:8495 length:1323 start_codon:yes stop_codon:yes gene_type:complete
MALVARLKVPEDQPSEWGQQQMTDTLQFVILRQIFCFGFTGARSLVSSCLAMGVIRNLRQRRQRLSMCLGMALALLPCSIEAAEIQVNSPDELLRVAKAAKPGDVIVVSGNDWKDVEAKLTISGTSEQPIIIRSDSAWTGQSSLQLVGEHVVLDGFTFRDGSLKEGHVMQVHGAHCRVTRCTFKNYNPKKTSIRFHWLSLYGHHHRVDHCLFEGQDHSGVTLVVWLLGDGQVGSHRIERNHFKNRAKGDGNGFETLRIGTSETSMKKGNCVVSGNLFENCDGEIEIISNKSCDNVYEKNTFVGCAGTLTLRHGNRCVVRENLILGDGERQSGGIRIVGEGHKIIGNHIEGVGNRINGAIALSAGVPNAKLNQYAQVRHILIDRNTLIGNAGEEIVLGQGIGSHDRTLMPVDVTVTNTRREGESLIRRLEPQDVGPNVDLQ